MLSKQLETTMNTEQMILSIINSGATTRFESTISLPLITSLSQKKANTFEHTQGSFDSRMKCYHY